MTQALADWRNGDRQWAILNFPGLDDPLPNMPRWECMRKPSGNEPEDEVQAGFMAVHRLLGDLPSVEPEPEPKQPARSLRSQLLSELGREGGKIGGKRRAENMTPEQRRRSARKAARARWTKIKAS